MQTKRLPYEVLFRFDEAGALIGSHVQWRHVVFDEKSNKIAEAIEPAKPVTVGEAEGFPLSDILTEVQKGAVRQAEAKSEELIELQLRHEKTMSALNSASAEIGRLKRDLAAASPAAATMGPAGPDSDVLG